jgi:hypothetical protein
MKGDNVDIVVNVNIGDIALAIALVIAGRR